MPATTPSRSWLGNGSLTSNGLPSHAREQVAGAGIFSHVLSREGFIKGSARWGTGPTHWPARTRKPARGQRGALGNHRVRRFIS